MGKEKRNGEKDKGKIRGINITQSMSASIGLLIAVILICTVFGWQTRQFVYNQTKEEVEEASKDCCYRFSTHLSAYMKIVQAMIYCMPDNEDVLNIDNLKAINMMNQIDYVHSAYIVDTTGKAISNQGIFLDLKDNNIVKRVLKSGRNCYSQLTYGVNGENAVIFIGVPITDSNKMLTGVGMIAVKASLFSEKISGSKAIGKGVCILIDEEGNVADSYIGQPSELKNVENLFEYLKEAKYPGKEGYTRLLNEIAIKKTNQREYEKDGKKYYISYTPIRVINGYLVAIYEYDCIFDIVNGVKKNTGFMVLGIAVAFMVFFVVLLAINKITAKSVERKNKELETRAEMDALTTLYNKAATEKYVKEYLEYEGKYSRSLLFVVDVDNFKTINDTKGHAFGDIVLSAIGKKLSSEFRVTDIVGRIGGDEFLIFLKHIPNHEIEVREAEKIVEFFRELEPGQYVKTKVTASIGGAVYPEDGEDFETLFKAADEAVYKAKKRGRDGYSFYREEDS